MSENSPNETFSEVLTSCIYGEASAQESSEASALNGYNEFGGEAEQERQVDSLQMACQVAFQSPVMGQESSGTYEASSTSIINNYANNNNNISYEYTVDTSGNENFWTDISDSNNATIRQQNGILIEAVSQTADVISTFNIDLDGVENKEDQSQDGEVSTTSLVTSKRSQRPRKSANKSKISTSKSGTRKKSTYKHVPHSEKPPHLVAKRNARERRRVHAVNLAFVKLRKAIPFENKRGKRISKVRILQKSIDYIRGLQTMVNEHDGLPPIEEITGVDDSHLFAF